MKAQFIIAAIVAIALTGCKNESAEQRNAREFKPEQSGQPVYSAPANDNAQQQKNAKEFKPEAPVNGGVIFDPTSGDKKK